MNRSVKVFLGTVSLLLFLATQGLALQRSITIVSDSSGEQVSEFTGSYALVIGVSKYTNGWPKLPGVKSDVDLVTQDLQKLGFEVTTLTDPDSAALEQGFKDFISEYGYSLNNRLLFYFAGHGHTVTPKYGGTAMGYIVPTDAPNPGMNLRLFKDRAMSMQRIEEYCLNMDARHAIFLFDSCFSGSLFSLSRAIPEHISYKTGEAVRQFITSGGADETVPDTSIFRQQFLTALKGGGDLNQDGYITGTELGQFIQTKVTNYSKGSQNPQYGKIRHPHDG